MVLSRHAVSYLNLNLAFHIFSSGSGLVLAPALRILSQSRHLSKPGAGQPASRRVSVWAAASSPVLSPTQVDAKSNAILVICQMRALALWAKMI